MSNSSPAETMLQSSRDFSNRKKQRQRLAAEESAFIGESLEVHAFMKCLTEVAQDAERKSSNLKPIKQDTYRNDPPTYLLNMAETYGFSLPRPKLNQRFTTNSAARSFCMPFHRRILGKIKEWVNSW